VTGKIRRPAVITDRWLRPAPARPSKNQPAPAARGGSIMVGRWRNETAALRRDGTRRRALGAKVQGERATRATTCGGMHGGLADARFGGQPRRDHKVGRGCGRRRWARHGVRHAPGSPPGPYVPGRKPGTRACVPHAACVRARDPPC
jgi:hypothetical protein